MDHQRGPRVCPQKGARDRLIRWAASKPEWVVAFADECWWSRVTEPNMHSWTPAERPLRLIEKADPLPKGEPKAISCYGLLRHDTGGMLLRFVEGRPVSELTEQFLLWACGELAAEGKRALLLVWDNAGWHISARVRAWIREHNRAAKRKGGVRIVVCLLPTKSPWLNNIEPKWIWGKRAVAEPDRVLDPAEIVARACAYYNVPLLPHLSTQVR
jgi:DDE superfamily endonuclease